MMKKKHEALSLLGFHDRFGTEKSCREHLIQLRWPRRNLPVVEAPVAAATFQVEMSFIVTVVAVSPRRTQELFFTKVKFP